VRDITMSARCVLVSVVGLLSVALVGCSDDAASEDPPRATIDLASDPFTVPAGEERYFCWTQTIERDVRIDRFDYAARPIVHHLVVSRSLVPQEDGFSECDVLFAPTWAPMFGAGSGDLALEAPEGASHDLPAGTQIVMQLHLLNLGAEDVTDEVSVTMREAEPEDQDNIGIFSFGTTDIDLPAGTSTAVVNDCTLDKDVEIFALLPHMHYLGTSLTLETGPSLDALEESYRRDPWDFDDQQIDEFPLSLSAGTATRTTCSYGNNTTDDVVFGESSFDEMCFLVGFATNTDVDLDGCLTLIGDDVQVPVPPDPAAGVCGEHEVNDEGIGQACTKGGDECPSGLTCTADQNDTADGFCLQIGGCTTTSDCGGGFATCCAPPEAGGLINICLPEACRPAECIPQDD